MGDSLPPPRKPPLAPRPLEDNTDSDATIAYVRPHDDSAATLKTALPAALPKVTVPPKRGEPLEEAEPARKSEPLEPIEPLDSIGPLEAAAPVARGERSAPSDPSRDEAPVEGLPVVGEIVDGRYRIERTIGVGGMAHVFAAHDMQRKIRVALKILDPTLRGDASSLERIAREARAMAALQGEHIVRVYDVGMIQPIGLPFIVMEFLEGSDLGVHLARGGPLSAPDAIRWIDQTLQALEEAHAAGLVHRDLKPRNLFLVEDGVKRIKVLDFGIARGFGGRIGKSQTITRMGDVVGTISYMAPEQIRSGRDVEPRTDIWAVGVTFYRLLSNKMPFKAEEEEGSVVDAILHREPTPLRTHRPDLPVALERLVMRCLKKDPDERFSTASELRAALRAIDTAAVPTDRTVPMARAPVNAATVMMDRGPARPAPPFVADGSGGYPQQGSAPFVPRSRETGPQPASWPPWMHPQARRLPPAVLSAIVVVGLALVVVIVGAIAMKACGN